MKILFVTFRCFPHYGGVESVVRLLGLGLTELGHTVRVVTREPSDQPDTVPFEVIRRPRPWSLLVHYRWADVVVLHGPAISLSWPSLIARKPTVAVHYMVPRKAHDRWRLVESLRQRIVDRCFRHLAPSDAFGATLDPPATGFRHPHDDSVFRILPGANRDRDLVFLGRFEELKGVSDLLIALAALRARGRRYTLTLIGNGSERESLIRQVRDSGLEEQVVFRGNLDGEELVQTMNRHKLVVVPSRYDEPFGMVALEGIACGCVAVGTAGGGLPTAIGPCGVTVPNCDPPALAAAMEQLLETPGELDHYRTHIAPFVAEHSPRKAAEIYLRLITPPAATPTLHVGRSVERHL